MKLSPVAFNSLFLPLRLRQAYCHAAGIFVIKNQHHVSTKAPLAKASGGPPLTVCNLQLGVLISLGVSKFGVSVYF